MTDFRLDVVADGSTVALCPVGVLDHEGARVLLDAVDAVRGNSGAFVAIRLDGVDSYTEDGLRVLALADPPVPGCPVRV